MTLKITLTRDNGMTREVCYTVPFTPTYGHHLFDTLVRQAFEACYGDILQRHGMTRRAEGDDNLSREASHYTPEA